MLLALLVVVFAAGALGAALAPSLVNDYPLALLALNPWPRHMILVAPHTPVVPFVLVATGRSFLAAAVGYELGRRYGAAGLSRLLSGSARAERFVERLHRLFQRAGTLLLFLLPGPLTGALGGMAQIPRRIALTALLVGQLGWVYLNYRLGSALAPFTEPILLWLREHMLPATLVCAVLVLLYQWRARRRRPRRARRDET